jgi:hypothetical protein
VMVGTRDRGAAGLDRLAQRFERRAGEFRNYVAVATKNDFIRRLIGAANEGVSEPDCRLAKAGNCILVKYVGASKQVPCSLPRFLSVVLLAEHLTIFIHSSAA